MLPAIKQITKYCIGKPLILMGGTDIGSSLYGKSPLIMNDTPDIIRDIKEENQVLDAMSYKRPIIGICRGAQLLCALAGGDLYQHSVGHNCTHDIFIRKITDNSMTKINDVAADHHQIMRCENIEKHTIYGFANKETTVYNHDYTTEIISVVPEIVFFHELNALAIQPHPEWMLETHPFNVYLTVLIRHLFGDKHV